MSERILFISNTQIPTRLDFPAAANKKIETDILSSLIGYKGFKCQLMYLVADDAEVPCDEKYIHRLSYHCFFAKKRQITEIRQIVDNNKPDVIICMDPEIALHCDEFHASKFIFILTYFPASYNIDGLKKFKPGTPYEYISTSLELNKTLIEDYGINPSKTFLPLVSYNDYDYKFLSEKLPERVNDIMWYDVASEGLEYILKLYKKAIEAGEAKKLVLYYNDISQVDNIDKIISSFGLENEVEVKRNKTFAEFMDELKLCRYCICPDTTDFNLLPFYANCLMVPAIYVPSAEGGTESNYIPESGNATYNYSDERLPIKELNEKDMNVEGPIIYSLSNTSHDEVQFNFILYSILMSIMNINYIEKYRYSIDELTKLSESQKETKDEK